MGPLRTYVDPLKRPVRALAAVALAMLLGSSAVVGQSPSVPPPVGGSAPVAPLASVVPGAPRVRALADKEVFGFLPCWELDGAAQSVDLDRLTTLAFFSVEAGPKGRLIRKPSEGGGCRTGYQSWQSDGWKALMAAAKSKGVRVVLTVDRMSWSAVGRTKTIKLLRSATARTKLAADIASELQATGADGVNLDFEPMPAEVRDRFTAFVRELRTALDAVRPGLQITFDITASVPTYDIAALTADDAADAVFLMAYDFRNGSAAYAASLAPLVDSVTGFDIQSTMVQLVAVADPAHVILGLPWYGRAWTTKGPEAFSPTRSGRDLTGPGISLYRDAVEIARENGRQYDPVAETAWTVYVRKACDTCPEAWRQVWYDDVDGFAAKIRFALDQGLRGIGMWALGQTGSLPGMWTVIDLTIGGRVDTQAPDGQASVGLGPLGRHDGLPVADGPVTVDLRGSDEQGGSGLAYVRLSNDPGVGTDGALLTGSTWPARGSVAWSVVDGQVVVPPTAPTPKPTKKPTKKPKQTPRPSADPEPSVPPVIASSRAIQVQWRDVAGNWSTPVAVDVWYAPEGSVEAAPSASPGTSPGASFPAGSPGASDGSGGAEAPSSEAAIPTPAPTPTRIPPPPPTKAPAPAPTRTASPP